jgi:hypothetical protein
VSTTVPMTARQRAVLARLRVNHPRATVSVLSRQSDRPLVQVKMRWAGTSVSRWFWLTPDGERISSRELGRVRR